MDPVSLDKYAKVLYALIKKKYLVPRTHLILDWRPLWELFRFWDDSSFSMRGLLKCATEFKTQLRQVIKVCRGYFSDESTQEMLTLWKPMLCPADRSMATGAGLIAPAPGPLFKQTVRFFKKSFRTFIWGAILKDTLSFQNSF